MTTAPQITSPPPGILWEQYELHVGLYKEYLHLLVKFNAFYYAATGDEVLAGVSDLVPSPLRS